MKRIEMVKYLQSNTQVELSRVEASYLLRLLEIKGMLPPLDTSQEYTTDDIEYITEADHYYQWEDWETVPDNDETE